MRIRDAKYWDRYSHEVTFREGRNTGKLTEVEKIVRGDGDFHLHGFASANGRYIQQWVLLSLSAFRTQWKTGTVNVVGAPVNRDFNPSSFIAVDVHSLDKSVVAARSSTYYETRCRRCPLHSPTQPHDLARPT